MEQESVKGDSRLYDLVMAAPLILFCVFALSGFGLLMPKQLQAPVPNYSLIVTERPDRHFPGDAIGPGLHAPPARRQGAGLLAQGMGVRGRESGICHSSSAQGSSRARYGRPFHRDRRGGHGGIAHHPGVAGKGVRDPAPGAHAGDHRPLRLFGHPLYLFEQLATLGVALQYRQPWALLLVVASITIQFPRMHYEECVLRDTFPAYDAYARATPRVVPFLRPGSSWLA